jgi:hypothetical protein
VLKTAFPGLEGLYPPSLCVGASQLIPGDQPIIRRRGVQVHYFQNHWVTSALDQGQVHVWDGLPSKPTPALMKQLGVLYRESVQKGKDYVEAWRCDVGI